VWIGILIFTATYSQNWFKLRNFSRNLWLGNHFFHQYLSSPHLLYHLNRTCLFSRDLLKYMRCFNLKVVIELLGFYLPLHCLLSRFHTALDCLFLSLFFFANHWTVYSNESNLPNSNYNGREKKKREERSETPKPNEAVTKFDGNLYSIRY
jgi:hypothetical protein